MYLNKDFDLAANDIHVGVVLYTFEGTQTWINWFCLITFMVTCVCMCVSVCNMLINCKGHYCCSIYMSIIMSV